MGINPIHQNKGQWYFWDETWAYRVGPFATVEIARTEFMAYCHDLNYEGDERNK